jgi:hypothetical protein
VELWINECSTSGYNGKSEYDILVKRADEQLQMIDLCFALIHPAMLRRIVFSANERDGWADYTESGYGIPCDATDKGDIYINELFSGVVSSNKAMEWIVDKLKEIGIYIMDQN